MDLGRWIKRLKVGLNPIPTGCCHVTLIYGLIPPMAGRNMVNKRIKMKNILKPIIIQILTQNLGLRRYVSTYIFVVFTYPMAF